MGRSRYRRLQKKTNLADDPVPITALNELFGDFTEDIEEFLEVANKPLKREIDRSEAAILALLIVFLRGNSVKPDGSPIPSRGRIPAGSTLRPDIQGKLNALEKVIRGELESMRKKIAELTPAFLDKASARAKRQVRQSLITLPFPPDFDPQDPPRSATAANRSGIDRNIENILQREAARAIELIENAIPGGRELALGVMDDARNFHFNRAFVDQSIDGHFRAQFRRTWFENSNQFFRFFKLFRKTGDNSARSSRFQGRIGTIEDWNTVGEREGFPTPVQHFGLGHGSMAFFFPIPESTVVRDDLKVNK